MTYGLFIFNFPSSNREAGYNVGETTCKIRLKYSRMLFIYANTFEEFDTLSPIQVCILDIFLLIPT